MDTVAAVRIDIHSRDFHCGKGRVRGAPYSDTLLLMGIAQRKFDMPSHHQEALKFSKLPSPPIPQLFIAHLAADLCNRRKGILHENRTQPALPLRQR